MYTEWDFCFVCAQEPVCQVMLNILDELGEISADRQTLLTEVLEWMEGYPPDSLPGPRETSSDEYLQYDQVDGKLFTNWDVTKNIRRLSALSEEMGLVKLDGDGVTKQDKVGDRRKLLEDKMNKQKSRYIATKVFDGTFSSLPS